MSKVPDLAIGSEVWPGVSKLTEECGELLQVLGKIAAFPNGPHPDGTDLVARLQDEMGDVRAAMTYVISENHLNRHTITARVSKKISLFTRWHQNEKDHDGTGTTTG